MRVGAERPPGGCIRIAYGTGIGLLATIRVRSKPSMSSIETKLTSPMAPASKAVTTLGCLTLPSACISSVKRAWAAACLSLSALMILRASSRPRRALWGLVDAAHASFAEKIEDEIGAEDEILASAAGDFLDLIRSEPAAAIDFLGDGGHIGPGLCGPGENVRAACGGSASSRDDWRRPWRKTAVGSAALDIERSPEFAGGLVVCCTGRTGGWKLHFGNHALGIGKFVRFCRMSGRFEIQK